MEAAKNNPLSFIHVEKAEIDLDKDTDIYSSEVYNKAAENLKKLEEDGILINEEKPCLYVYRLTRNGHSHKDTDIYSSEVYNKAAENLKKLEEDGILINEEKPCLYVYRLTRNGHSQTGIVCCTSIDDYLNGVIKKHELTKEDKEKDRTNYVLSCNANTSPIFLTYKAESSFEEVEKTVAEKEPLYDFTSEDGIGHTVWIIDDDNTSPIFLTYKAESSFEEVEKTVAEKEPLYDFTSEDGIGHTVWIIDDDSEIEKIVSYFKNIPSLYIADGHHRNASAANAAIEMRKQNPDYTGEEEFNYCLSVIFPSNELQIMDYNRIVKDLNGLTEDDFLQKISDHFFIRPYTRIGSFRPFMKHQFGMYLGNKWYMVTVDESTIPDDPIGSLDVSLLYDNLLNPVLGIGNPRTDDRIDYVGGVRGLAELERAVIVGRAKIAFSMYPTSIEELMNNRRTYECCRQ